MMKLQTPPPTPPLEGRGVTPPGLPEGEEGLPHCPTGMTALLDGMMALLDGMMAQLDGMTARLLPSLQGEGLGVGSLTSPNET